MQRKQANSAKKRAAYKLKLELKNNEKLNKYEDIFPHLNTHIIENVTQ